jgi:aspartyl-tRNA(Asn)/glutamyl-tRNA(Gln) amidotransferase subunit C
MFSRADVERIARLARLELTDEEKDLYARQLGEILDYAAQVQAVETTDVAPTAQAVTGTTEWREDRAVASLAREDVLRSAPNADTAAGLFKVPRVLGS